MPTPTTPPPDPGADTDPDADTHLARTTRRVNVVTDAGRPARLVVVTHSLDATEDEVWSALTGRDRLAAWFGEVRGELRPGGDLALADRTSATVRTCTPREHASLSWTTDGVEGSLDLSLRPVPGATVVQVDQRTPRDEDDLLRTVSAGLGWEVAAARLAAHLTGADGRLALHEGLLRAAADGWAEAVVADGGDHDAARAAAQAAVASYR